MKAFFKRLKARVKLKHGAILALVIGCISQALGFDLAPTEIDLLVTAASTLAAVWERAH